MSELYWLGVLDNLDSCDQFVVFLAIIVLFYLGIMIITFNSDYDEPFEVLKRIFKRFIYTLVFGITIYCLCSM